MDSRPPRQQVSAVRGFEEVVLCRVGVLPVQLAQEPVSVFVSEHFSLWYGSIPHLSNSEWLLACLS